MKHSNLPLLNPGNHRETSPATPAYNCIAWAAGDDQAFWWPDPHQVCYWPAAAPRAETIDAFTAAYATKGYVVCDDGELERGFERIALYAKNGVPTHAARQLPSGKWTSKLGMDVDIEHNALGTVEGGIYGVVVRYMRRPRQAEPPPPPKAAAKPRTSAQVGLLARAIRRI